MDGSGLCDYRVRSLALAESMMIKTVILHEQIIVSIRVNDGIFGNWKVEIKPPCATKSLSNLDPNHQVVSKEPVNWMLFTTHSAFKGPVKFWKILQGMIYIFESNFFS